MLPGKINAMENCARCNGGLTTLLGEVGVRFIALFVLFDRTQGPVWDGKAGQGDLEFPPRSSGVGASR